MRIVSKVQMDLDGVLGSGARASWIRAVSLAAAGAAGTLAIVAAFKGFERDEGDATVYWVFAHSMWSQGPFHYGLSGTSHGATSPLWALLLSAVQFGTTEPRFVWKVTALCVWLMVCLSTFRLSVRVTGSTTQGLAAMTLMLLFQPMRRYASAGYETALFTLLVTEAVLLTIDVSTRPGKATRLWPWLVVLGLLPLGRPEGLFVLLVLGGLGVFSNRANRARLLVAVGLTLLPSAAFYLWMYSKTGLLIPSSVTARQLLSSLHDEYLAPVNPVRILARCAGVVFQGTGALWHLAGGLQAAAIVIGIVTLWKSCQKFAAVFVGLSATIAALMLVNNPGYYAERYACPFAPMGLVVLTHGAFVTATRAHGRARRFGRPIRWIIDAAMAACAIVLLAPVVLAVTHAALMPAALPVDALDRLGSEELNQFLRPTDTVLVYEVQTAYHLAARTMSADGIVGGQITPYLRNRDLEGFLRTYHVTHVLASTAFSYRSTFRGTVLEALTKHDAAVPLGGRIRLGGLSFRKLAQRRERPGNAHWFAAYAVE